MVVSYPKPKQFAPTTRVAGGQSKAEQIRFLQRGRGNFWVPNQVLEQERKGKIPSFLTNFPRHGWVLFFLCSAAEGLFGMKSHDCHVFMQRLIPVAFRGLLPSTIWGPLTDISNFFRSLCSPVIKVTEMQKWEAKIVEIICKLEIIFPPAFFDSMKHLAIHLPYEARVGGPVQFRWMYPFERHMRKLKSTIGNKNHVEASIVEAFILYEISHFCSRYFGDDVETSWNQPPRNYGGIGTNVPGATINSADETDYYGVLKEVIELLYYGHSGHQETIILFNCDWYDTNRGIRVNVEHGIVDINPGFKLSTREPFCLASQAQQVYYTPYPVATDRTIRGWLAACKIKSRHLIETLSTSSSGEVDDIFQDDDPSIVQGSSLAIDLTAYQSLQLCAEGVTEVEVDANTSEEEEDYGEEKDSESSRNSDNVEDGDDSDDSLARRRSSSSGSQEQHNFNHPQLFTDSSVAPDIQQTIDPLINYNFAPDHENEGPSSSTGKKGRSRNFKGIRPLENRESRKWVKLTDDKLQFVDPNIPRAITSLWKSRFDGPYFTFECVPQSKIAKIYNCFKDPADNRHVRDAFLNCMKHRWSDNLRDEKLKWDKNSAYVPCWIPAHIWPQLLTYWDSDEYKRLSAREAKNRSSGERIESRGGVQPPHQEKFKETHTFRKKAGKDQEPSWINEKAKYRYDTYVAECTDSHGSDASSWPHMDNEAWVKAVGGCSSNFMPGIGSQVNLEMLANMTAAQNNMSQTIAQSVAAALAAHGISPQAGHHLVAPPQPSHGPGLGLRMNSAFTYSTDSTQTSPMVPEYQQQRQFSPQDDDASYF
ncbi:hypothetical protein SLEP1_g27667 [Rubroshorea leprosula]|uniref:DUF4218 domain-containing protein n=1 Tax=Rubroshorea leprosula TaxID=152421 RepID=A0AAV5K3S7_9ROSI|nr:hypothetical protein SLEP1_g27667 [Rubroshorea leprosula]